MVAIWQRAVITAVEKTVDNTFFDKNCFIILHGGGQVKRCRNGEINFVIGHFRPQSDNSYWLTI